MKSFGPRIAEDGIRFTKYRLSFECQLRKGRINMVMKKALFMVLAAGILVSPACSKKDKQGSAGGQDLGFAAEIGFNQGVIDTVKGVSLGSIEQLVGIDENFEERLAPGLVFQVSGKIPEEALYELREKLSDRNYGIYIIEKNFGYSPDRISILNDPDPYEMVRIMGTSGINYGIENTDIIDKLKQWERRFSFDIIAVGLIFIEIVFEKPPGDMNSFAREVYRFCPDVVDQGTETVEALASEMRRSGRLSLWWD